MRVCFQYADEQYLYVTPLDEVSEQPYLVRYNVPQINEEFAETCKLLWRHAQVNLLDVAIDEAGILTPSFIVLEPDYSVPLPSVSVTTDTIRPTIFFPVFNRSKMPGLCYWEI